MGLELLDGVRFSVDPRPSPDLQKRCALCSVLSDHTLWKDCPGLSALRAIEGAPHSQPIAVQDMCVDHRGADALVAEQFLDCPDVIAVLQEMRSEGVTKCVTRCPLRDP